MAKIAEQLIVIKVSQLVKDTESTDLTAIDDATQSSLVEVIEQLVDDPKLVVEVLKG